MTPKPRNAFAQQNLQRPKDLKIQPLEEDSLSTPMTTMSMFIGPELTHVDYKEPSELKIRSSGDPSLKASTDKGKFSKRAFAEPLGAATAYSASISEHASHSKPSGGLSYMKFKFNGRNKKNKPSGSLSQPLTTPAPSQLPPHTPDPAAMPHMHSKEAKPEYSHKTCQKLPSRFVPSSISTTTTQSIATRQSQYASALRNDAMVLGNILMSPTHSSSYTVGGYPAIVGVSHPSIVSMSGSIFDRSPPPVGTTSNNHMYLDPPAHPETYDASYIAPLPPPPGEELMEQNSFHQQLPFYLQLASQQQTQQTNLPDQPLFHYQHDICNSGTWEQMHVQHPGTMPQFSPVNPKHSHQDVSKRDAMLAQAFENSPETVDQRNAWIESSLYNQNASDTKSESGIEAYRAVEDSDETTVNFTTTLGNSIRKSVSNYELRYTSHRSGPPTRKPVSQNDGNSSTEPAKASNEVPPTSPIFRPAGHETVLEMTPIALKPDRYEVGEPEQLQLAQDILQDLQGTVSLSQDASDPSSNKRPGHISEAQRRESASAQNPQCFNPCGGYQPSTQHAHCQARNNLVMQMGHQFNYVHHHLDADVQTLRNCVEDAKNYLAGNPSCRADEKFMNQFRQMCIQNNGFRQYLERIEQQTSNLRPGIATDVLPGVSVEMASRFAAHESHYQNEFGQINRNLLTLRENFYGFQRNMNKQMSQISQKMDLLLEAQGKITSSAGEFANQDRNLQEQKPLGGPCRRKDEGTDIAAIAVKEESAVATVATISAASSPAAQVSTPITMRNPTPLATKLPIMAAALTSTPPHVPQLPPSQSQSSPFAKVTITDPDIPSPSAVTNARRIRKGDVGEQGDAEKEYRQAGIMANGLASTPPIHNHGSHIHPALRSKEDTERLAEGQDKHQVAERAHEDKSKVLWRRPSDNGEIGGRWYKAAMEQ